MRRELLHRVQEVLWDVFAQESGMGFDGLSKSDAEQKLIAEGFKSSGEEQVDWKSGKIDLELSNGRSEMRRERF